MQIRFPPVLLPWVFVPLLWVLGFGWRAFAVFQPVLSTAFLPLAIVLGRKYGWRGAVAVAVGGIVLPFQITHYATNIFSPADLDLYVLSLAAASAAAGLFPWRRCLEFIRTCPLAWTVIVLLPLQLGLGMTSFPGGNLWYSGDLYLVFWAALIVAGMSGVEWSVLLLPATIIGAGFAARLSGALPWYPEKTLEAGSVDLPGLGVVSLTNIYINYTLSSAAALVPLFCCFGFGRWLARWRSDPSMTWPTPWRARTTITVLAIAGAGGNIFRMPLEKSGLDASWLRFLPGHEATGMLAALIAGFLLSRPGVVWAVALGMILALLELFSSGHQSQGGRLLYELWRFGSIAIIFGWCGVELRKALGVPTPVRTSLHFKYVATISLAIVALVPEEHWNENIRPNDVLFILTAALLLVSIGLRIWWQRRAEKNPSLESEYEGWIALTALIVTGVAIAENFGKIKEEFASLQQLPEFVRTFRESGMENTNDSVLIVAALTLAALWTALTTLKVVLENLHSCWRDARRALAKLATFFGLTRLSAWLSLPEAEPTATPAGQPTDPPPAKKTPRPVRILVYASRTALALLFALGAFWGTALLFPEGWSESGESDEPVATAPVAKPKPNPHLWQAAKEFTASMPIEKSAPTTYPASLTTHWHYDPSDQTHRERYAIEVSEDLDHGLILEFTLQERRYFLWCQGIEKFSARVSEEQKRAWDKIHRRALELAAETPKLP